MEMDFGETDPESKEFESSVTTLLEIRKKNSDLVLLSFISKCLPICPRIVSFLSVDEILKYFKFQLTSDVSLIIQNLSETQLTMLIQNAVLIDHCSEASSFSDHPFFHYFFLHIPRAQIWKSYPIQNLIILKRAGEADDRPIDDESTTSSSTVEFSQGRKRKRGEDEESRGTKRVKLSDFEFRYLFHLISRIACPRDVFLRIFDFFLASRNEPYFQHLLQGFILDVAGEYEVRERLMSFLGYFFLSKNPSSIPKNVRDGVWSVVLDLQKILNLESTKRSSKNEEEEDEDKMDMSGDDIDIIGCSSSQHTFFLDLFNLQSEMERLVNQVKIKSEIPNPISMEVGPEVKHNNNEEDDSKVHFLLKACLVSMAECRTAINKMVSEGTSVGSVIEMFCILPRLIDPTSNDERFIKLPLMKPIPELLTYIFKFREDGNETRKLKKFCKQYKFLLRRVMNNYFRIQMAYTTSGREPKDYEMRLKGVIETFVRYTLRVNPEQASAMLSMWVFFLTLKSQSSVRLSEPIAQALYFFERIVGQLLREVPLPQEQEDIVELDSIFMLTQKPTPAITSLTTQASFMWNMYQVFSMLPKITLKNEANRNNMGRAVCQFFGKMRSAKTEKFREYYRNVLNFHLLYQRIFHLLDQETRNETVRILCDEYWKDIVRINLEMIMDIHNKRAIVYELIFLLLVVYRPNNNRQQQFVYDEVFEIMFQKEMFEYLANFSKADEFFQVGCFFYDFAKIIMSTVLKMPYLQDPRNSEFVNRIVTIFNEIIKQYQVSDNQNENAVSKSMDSFRGFLDLLLNAFFLDYKNRIFGIETYKLLLRQVCYSFFHERTFAVALEKGVARLFFFRDVVNHIANANSNAGDGDGDIIAKQALGCRVASAFFMKLLAEMNRFKVSFDKILPAPTSSQGNNKGKVGIGILAPIFQQVYRDVATFSKISKDVGNSTLKNAIQILYSMFELDEQGVVFYFQKLDFAALFYKNLFNNSKVFTLVLYSQKYKMPLQNLYKIMKVAFLSNSARDASFAALFSHICNLYRYSIKEKKPIAHTHVMEDILRWLNTLHSQARANLNEGSARGRFRNFAGSLKVPMQKLLTVLNAVTAQVQGDGQRRMTGMVSTIIGYFEKS